MLTDFIAFINWTKERVFGRLAERLTVMKNVYARISAVLLFCAAMPVMADDTSAESLFAAAESEYQRMNDVLAVAMYHSAAESGHVEALYRLSCCYEYGFGVERDATRAAELLRRAAEQGCAQARHTLNKELFERYVMGKIAYNSSRYEEAAAIFRLVAESGYAAAQYELGCCYNLGMGVAQNKQEAFAWFKSAAEGGYVLAQTNVAQFYFSGIGTAKDEAVALYWFRQAAEQGDARAQYNLGVMLLRGLGTMPNREEALLWLHRAAEQGHPQAQTLMKRLSH